MPPLILLVAGVAGGVALVRFAARERRRVNDELEALRLARLAQEKGSVRLQRDPATGAYRPPRIETGQS